MKAIALKMFVGLFGAFAAYYSYFLGSVFYELYGPSARFCGTAQVWALQGGRGFLCATSVARFCRALVRWQAKGELVILILCALANLVIFIPTL